MQAHIAFSLRHIVPDDDYCLRKCEKKLKVAILNHLHLLSQQRWMDAKQEGSANDGNGIEWIPQDKIRGPKPSVITQEVMICVTHASGRLPLAGYKDGDVFHIVWIDRQFKLYDHGA